MAVVTAWNEDMPSWSAFSPFKLTLPNRRLKPAPNLRTCTKRVRKLKMMPVPTSRYSNRPFQTKSLIWLTRFASESIVIT